MDTNELFLFYQTQANCHFFVESLFEVKEEGLYKLLTLCE